MLFIVRHIINQYLYTIDKNTVMPYTYLIRSKRSSRGTTESLARPSTSQVKNTTTNANYGNGRCVEYRSLITNTYYDYQA